jgi:hypothetical protein
MYKLFFFRIFCFLYIALELIFNHVCVRISPLELRVVWADEYENPDAVRMGMRLVEDSVHGKSEEEERGEERGVEGGGGEKVVE